MKGDKSFHNLECRTKVEFNYASLSFIERFQRFSIRNSHRINIKNNQYPLSRVRPRRGIATMTIQTQAHALNQRKTF